MADKVFDLEEFKRLYPEKIIPKDSPCFNCHKNCGGCVLDDGKQMMLKQSDSCLSNEKEGK